MSDQGYTPTTDQVLDSYRRSIVWARGSGAQSDAEFDRWLAEVRREAAEEAWDEGVATALNHAKLNPDGITLRLEKLNGDAWPHPYRKEVTA